MHLSIQFSCTNKPYNNPYILLAFSKNFHHSTLTNQAFKIEKKKEEKEKIDISNIFFKTYTILLNSHLHKKNTFINSRYQILKESVLYTYGSNSCPGKSPPFVQDS